MVGVIQRQLGQSIKDLKLDRESVVIGTKILPNHCAYNDVKKYVDGMLTRLGTDCIDLLMVHWPIDKNSMAHFASDAKIQGGGRDYAVADKDNVADAPPTEQAFKALMEVQQAGKVRHIGVSNFGVAQLKEAMKTGVKIALNQVCYNMIFRAVEFDIIPFCREHGIGIIAYSPLMQGLLTGKYETANDVPVFRARTRHFDGKRPKSRHGEDGHEELLFQALAAVQKIAADAKIAMSDLAIAWPLHTDGVCCVVGGATKETHVETNVRAVGVKIPDNVLQQLNEATDALKQAMGSNADLWQGGSDGRIM